MADMATSYLKEDHAKSSVSDKASPWQNGYKESFFADLRRKMGILADSKL